MLMTKRNSLALPSLEHDLFNSLKLASVRGLSQGYFYYSPKRDLLPLFSILVGKFRVFWHLKMKKVLAVAVNRFISTFPSLD